MGFNPEIPLSGMADSTYFKVYMSDVGLLRRKALKNVGDNMDVNTHVWSLPLFAFYRFKDYVSQELGW